MAWIKKRRSPVDLGTTHLDTVMEPGVYTQPFPGRGTKANGYPFEGQGGILEVFEWNIVSGTRLERYTSQNQGIAVRYYLSGAWTIWRDAMGKAVS